jgi:lipopolysaccharide export LptBFGC system permease protein LptF
MDKKPRRRWRLLAQYIVLIVLYLACVVLMGSIASLFVNDPNQQVGGGLLGGALLLAALLWGLRGRGKASR